MDRMSTEVQRERPSSSAVQKKYNANHTCHLKCSQCIQNTKYINFNHVFYVNEDIQNSTNLAQNSTNQWQNLSMSYFTFCFCSKSLKSGVDFSPTAPFCRAWPCSKCSELHVASGRGTGQCLQPAPGLTRLPAAGASGLHQAGAGRP